jgi:hypothetical protein
VVEKTLEMIAAALPGDGEEYLTCELYGEDHVRMEWNDASPRVCPLCFARMVVHVPRQERWPIAWYLWRTRYFPYRLRQFPTEEGNPGKQWVQWGDRRFFERPWSGGDWIQELTDEEA